jgi:hypothetical protein
MCRWLDFPDEVGYFVRSMTSASCVATEEVMANSAPISFKALIPENFWPTKIRTAWVNTDQGVHVELPKGFFSRVQRPG